MIAPIACAANRSRRRRTRQFAIAPMMMISVLVLIAMMQLQTTVMARLDSRTLDELMAADPTRVDDSSPVSPLEPRASFVKTETLTRHSKSGAQQSRGGVRPALEETSSVLDSLAATWNSFTEATAAVQKALTTVKPARSPLTASSFAFEREHDQKARLAKDKAAKAAASSGTIPVPVHHQSRDAVVVENVPPSGIPPARLTVPLEQVGLHWTVSLLVGNSNTSGPDPPLLPDFGSIRMRFVVDTGSADLVYFNRSDCLPNMFYFSTGALPFTQSTNCPGNNYVTSPSMEIVSGFGQDSNVFALLLDGESFIYTNDHLLIGSNLITLGAKVLGTTQPEYYLSPDTLMWISSNNSIRVREANWGNADPSDPSSFKLVNDQVWERTDGMLGIAFASASVLAFSQGRAQSSFMQIVSNGDTTATEPIFSLDFGGSALHLGGVSELYRSRLSWSSGPVDLLAGYHSFSVYHMTVCGVDMFQNLTSSWHGMVDTGSSCLGLPAEFFDMLISWMPLHCNLGLYDNQPHVCYITADIQNRNKLPTLSFRMADQGAEIFISLQDLLFQQQTLMRICVYRLGTMVGSVDAALAPALCVLARVSNGGRRLCLAERNVLTPVCLFCVLWLLVVLLRSGPNRENPIVFGSLVLAQLYGAFDMRSPSRVGFANRDATAKESRVQCAARVLCTGMQVHYDPLNMCLRPPCEDYYFFDYDETQKVCKLNAGFHILCGVLIGTFVMLEMGLNEAVIFLSNKVMRSGIVVGQ